MHDAHLAIAQALARPFQTPRGATLYQVGRADFAALGRLARTCQEAATAVRRLLWECTPLGARERARRAQVERARAFLRAAPLIASASWTRAWDNSDEYAHLRSRTSVAFNGRIRLRECYFPGRRMRRQMNRFGYRIAMPFRYGVGLTLTAPDGAGRVFVWTSLSRPSIDVWTGAFTERDGALSSLRYLTFLGREYWEQSQPAEALQRFARFTLPRRANLDFEAIVELPA